MVQHHQRERAGASRVVSCGDERYLFEPGFGSDPHRDPYDLLVKLAIDFPSLNRKWRSRRDKGHDQQPCCLPPDA
jgi:hypothetical protein